jgi:thermitase
MSNVMSRPDQGASRAASVSGAVAAIAATLLALPALAAGQRVDGDALADAGRAYAGEAIVRFEPGTTATERLAARRSAGVSLDRALELPRAQVVAVDGAVGAAVARLEREPGVAYAQPNYRYHALAVDPPDDSFFGDLWGLQDPAVPNPGVGALEAWETTRGAGQTIAIVDTGVALDHPDLAGNLWTGPNGEHGWDFVDGDDDPDDFHFHGTHVAGTAAAVAGNGIGIAGVAPEARIMAVRALDGDGSGSTADIANGIDYASANGADVINLSLGGPAGVGDLLMGDAVARAGQRDAVVVAAAGNDGHDNDVMPTTPCTLPQPNLICVAAVNQAGGRAGFSNYGAKTVDVGAPGTAILSAKADYDPILSEGFEGGLGGWSTYTAPGSATWTTTTAAASEGIRSATDSAAGDYVNGADSQLFTSAPLDLTAERGCRVHVDLRYEIQAPASGGSLFDYLWVGGVTDDEEAFDGLPFAGTSSGYSGGSFVAEEASISDLGGRGDVRPFLGLFANGSVRRDGAYADDLSVLCRRATYLDSKAAAGNYVAFQGTSMAAPHVAGVAALVGAADPGAPAEQVVAAISGSGPPLAALAGVTTSGRGGDAAAAIAAAVGMPDTPPAGEPGGGAGPGGASGDPQTPRTPATTRWPVIDLRRAPARVRVSRAGRFRYAFRATAGTTGRAVFSSAGRVESIRRARIDLARRGFGVARGGRVTLALRLSPRNRRLLRRERRLATNVSLVVRDTIGRTARATMRIVLLAPRR